MGWGGLQSCEITALLPDARDAVSENLASQRLQDEDLAHYRPVLLEERRVLRLVLLRVVGGGVKSENKGVGGMWSCAGWRALQEASELPERWPLALARPYTPPHRAASSPAFASASPGSPPPFALPHLRRLLPLSRPLTPARVPTPQK